MREARQELCIFSQNLLRGSLIFHGGGTIVVHSEVSKCNACREKRRVRVVLDKDRFTYSPSCCSGGILELVLQDSDEGTQARSMGVVRGRRGCHARWVQHAKAQGLGHARGALADHGRRQASRGPPGTPAKRRPHHGLVDGPLGLERGLLLATHGRRQADSSGPGPAAAGRGPLGERAKRRPRGLADGLLGLERGLLLAATARWASSFFGQAGN